MIFVTTRTGKITENIFAVSAVMVNMFVVRYGSSTICIDTGMGSGNIRRGLMKLGVAPESVSHVFLTHSDTDHAGCIGLFKNAKLCLSKNEEQMVIGKTPRKGSRFNRPINRDYILLEDGEEIHIGDMTVKAIDTPGHTRGSMSYLINGVYLFVGDTMALMGNKVRTFPGFINMDTETEKASIRKLAKLTGIKMMFTAHSGYTNDFSNAIKEWQV